jgi:capsular exopolysaccharide synthesis family protein
LISSETIAARVVEEVDRAVDIEQILPDLEVEAQGETQVLRISYTAADPELAQEVTQAFADTYLAYRRDQAVEDVLQESEIVEQRVQSVSEQLTDVTEDLAEAERTDDSALAASLETQRSVLIARLGVLQQQLDDLESESAAGRNPGDVIEPAAVPRAPSSPDHLRNGILGLFFGGLLGIGLAFLRERLDDRFRDRSDLERAIEAPVLAIVPRYSSKTRLVSAEGSQMAATEAYRSLRTNLQFIVAQRGSKSFLVTSPSAREGKTSTTANLGHLLAQTGERVIIVSSDLRRPSLGAYFDIEEGGEEKGLSSWLASDGLTLWDIIADPGIPNLRVIPSGPLPPNPAELLTSSRLPRLVQLLEANADFVLFDSPPILPVADPAVLAASVRDTLLVVNAASTQRSATIHARAELERVGAKLIGAVLNSFDRGTSPNYYGSYKNYSSQAPKRTKSTAADETKRGRFRLFGR